MDISRFLNDLLHELSQLDFIDNIDINFEIVILKGRIYCKRIFFSPGWRVSLPRPEWSAVRWRRTWCTSVLVWPVHRSWESRRVRGAPSVAAWHRCAVPPSSPASEPQRWVWLPLPECVPVGTKDSRHPGKPSGGWRHGAGSVRSPVSAA